MDRVTILSCCSASKNDSIPIPENTYRVFPVDYLSDSNLVSQLQQNREMIFKNPSAKAGAKTTYAIDLYTQTGFAYRQLTPNYRNQLKRLITSNNLSWLFLSAGYGIIHALEPAISYQATFNRTIAYQNKIPYTTNQWKDSLSNIIDSAVSKFDPDWLFFFGSNDYSTFFKDSKTWITDERPNIRLFESTGSAGPHWIAPLIGQLTRAIFCNQVTQFSQSYDRFTKQE